MTEFEFVYLLVAIASLGSAMWVLARPWSLAVRIVVAVPAVAIGVVLGFLLYVGLTLDFGV
jgi:hypothetical protein